jgi:hypothetical protein
MKIMEYGKQLKLPSQAAIPIILVDFSPPPSHRYHFGNQNLSSSQQQAREILLFTADRTYPIERRQIIYILDKRKVIIN